MGSRDPENCWYLNKKHTKGPLNKLQQMWQICRVPYTQTTQHCRPHTFHHFGAGKPNNALMSHSGIHNLIPFSCGTKILVYPAKQQKALTSAIEKSRIATNDFRGGVPFLQVLPFLEGFDFLLCPGQVVTAVTPRYRSHSRWKCFGHSPGWLVGGDLGFLFCARRLDFFFFVAVTVHISLSSGPRLYHAVGVDFVMRVRDGRGEGAKRKRGLPNEGKINL